MAGVHVTSVIAAIFALIGMSVVLKWLPRRAMAVGYVRQPAPGAAQPATTSTAPVPHEVDVDLMVSGSSAGSAPASLEPETLAGARGGRAVDRTED